jgi:hypothetical protein
VQNVNLLSFAFVDTTLFSATMTLKYGRHFDDERPSNLATEPYQDCRHILLRGPDNPSPANWKLDIDQFNYPVLSEWPGARAA